MSWTNDEIKGKILHKLTRKGKFEHSHTAIENLQAGFPGDLLGRVKENIEDLKRERILIQKKTSYGEHVSLDVEKNESVMRYILIFLKKE